MYYTTRAHYYTPYDIHTINIPILYSSYQIDLALHRHNEYDSCSVQEDYSILTTIPHIHTINMPTLYSSYKIDLGFAATRKPKTTNATLVIVS